MRRSLVKILGITALAISITFTNFSVPVMAIEPTNSIIIEDSKSSNDFISNEIENNIKSETTIENNKDNLKDESNNKEEEDQLNEIKEMLKESKTENEAESEIIEQEPLQYPDIKGDVIEDGNKYPIVLVHGFLGFGRDELLGYKYWGGLVDVQESLRDQGYETYTATVGPVSSNWDRACELYAYIVGGTVDYGEAHSKKYSHERYGRTFEGLYKDVSDANKIHLIGHSMGGQTVRTLTQLLSEGSEEEKNYNQENISPLFMGGKHWVRSVTTISTPNDGTTLSDLIPAKEFISKSIGVLGSINGKDNLSNCLYDFKLDQFGLKKQPGESYISYANRVKDSNIWSETKDIGPYDLSTYGAQELNKWVKAQPDVYYFSWVTKATKKLLITGYAVPQIGPMNIAFHPSAFLMGNYTRSYRGPVIDEDWFDNDGVVNSISQEGPRFGSNDVIKKFNGQPKVGQWNVMPTLINTDHMDIVGTFGDVEDWYIDYAEQLSNLPR